LFIKTDFGPAFLRIRKVDDNIWAFKGGTISMVNGLMFGGIEINFHRYFLRKDGTVKKKSGGISTLPVYTYYQEGEDIIFRLWENRTHKIKKPSGDVFDYIGVVYSLSGGKAGVVTPIKGTLSINKSESEDG
jgi:hypothetical protein